MKVELAAFSLAAVTSLIDKLGVESSSVIVRVPVASEILALLRTLDKCKSRRSHWPHPDYRRGLPTVKVVLVVAPAAIVSWVATDSGIVRAGCSSAIRSCVVNSDG